jgi:hypothetical protein
MGSSEQVVELCHDCEVFLPKEEVELTTDLVDWVRISFRRRMLPQFCCIVGRVLIR